jgi:hypothetical protein
MWDRVIAIKLVDGKAKPCHAMTREAGWVHAAAQTIEFVCAK